jgi:peptidoglycan/LPS O-acetylase OafA/YrhL
MASPTYSLSSILAFPNTITPKLVVLSLIPTYVHLNGPMWSIRVEILYSILFPLIYLLIKSRRARIPLLTILLLLALAPINRNLSVHYALAFGLGALIPFSRGIANFRYRTCAIISSIAVLYTRVFLEQFGIGLKGAEIAESVVSFVLVYCIYHNKRPMPVLDGRVGAYLGEISYSIYLIHYPILFSIATCAVKIVGSEKIQAQPLLFVLCFGALSSVIVIAASTINNVFVEDLGKRIGKMLLGPRRASAMS